MSIFSGKHIVLGVTGSIAAYKAADLASKLTQAGAQVDVILTNSAEKFVTPLTFQSVTGRRAYTDKDLWGNEAHVLHVGLGHAADLLVIAPCTANTIAKLAHGGADNLLTVTALASQSPLVIAPAMDGVLILASPVYFSRLSGTMACLIDRTRCFTFGKSGHLALKGKVGGALAVGWCRNLGMETTLASIHGAFLVHEMLAPSCHAAGALYGVGVVSGQRDESFSYKRDKLGVKDDPEGLHSTGLFVREAIRAAKGRLK